MNRAERDQEQTTITDPPRKIGDLHHKEQRFRLWYTKTGASIFLSQLELQRIFERAFRRSKLPLAFTSGFHPIPMLSFSRALPVGVASGCEWMDFFVRERLDVRELSSSLSRELPQGMRVMRIDELPCQRRAPISIREDFVLSFRNEGDAERFGLLWDEFLTKESCLVPKLTKKGEPSEVEIRPMIAASTRTGLDWNLAFDWQTLYVSPVFVLHSVDREFSLLQASLLKTGQVFE